jgi:hypothetical protein
MIPDAFLDRLYAAPLEDFTETRNAIVAELKAGGDEKAAAEAKSLRKPPVSAWAVNQLARSRPDDVGRLFAIRGDIAGAEDRAAMRRAAAERTKLLAALTSHAGQLLEEAGRAAGAATLERVTQTLQAGDDESERELILRGRLAKDLEPSGFGGFAGFSPGVEDEDENEDDPVVGAERERQVAALVAEAVEKEAAAAAADRQVSDVTEELRRAEKAAALAHRRAAAAREAADRAARP